MKKLLEFFANLFRRKKKEQTSVKVLGLMERIYQPLYDTNTVHRNGVSLVTFFQPLPEEGAKDYPKRTVAVSNVEPPGQLPHPSNFEITGISVLPGVLSGSMNVRTYVNASWLRLHINKRNYLVVPLELVTQLKPGWHAGNSLADPLFKFPDPIPFASGQDFGVEINTPVPVGIDQPIKLTVVLFGYYARPLF